MVYLDPGELRWRPYVLTWLNDLPIEMADTTKVKIYGSIAVISADTID